jgi:uncharacterized repeat protein (TIGR04052 family)
MKNLALRPVPFLLLPALFFACDGNDNAGEYQFKGGEFRIEFRAKVGDEDFACGESYEGIGSGDVMAEAQDFRFYVSDIRLIKTDGEEVDVEIIERAPFQASTVALLDFEDASGACATSGSEETNTSLLVSAPAGDYRGIRFSTSVPEELNHEDPLKNPGPLQVTAMQWNWLLGYKFMRAEMKPMSHGNMGGMGGMGENGAGAGGERPTHMAMDSQFHMGSLGCQSDEDAADPTFSCKKENRNDIYLEEFHPGEQAIEADVRAIFEDTDFEKMNHCHGAPNDVCIGNYRSVGVDYESGELLESQSVFRAGSKN